MIDPYFSATKIAWILDHVPGARPRATGGELAAGTVDTLLIWHLTGGQQHLTDLTNASRTLLMDLETGEWSSSLCGVFDVPPGILPEIRPSAGDFGMTRGLDYLPDGIPITGRRRRPAGLAGRPGLLRGRPGEVYLRHRRLPARPHRARSSSPRTQGLLTTRAASLAGEPPQFALEGSVFIAGAAVQWFRDGLKAIGAAPEIGELALQADPASEVIFVPALTGLGAPHWRARGPRHHLRPDPRPPAWPTSPARRSKGSRFQIADLIEAIQEDLEGPLTDLRVDGGMARSDPFLQFQADVLGQPIRRSPQTESTALGAALLAGLGVGLWPDRAHRRRPPPVRRPDIHTRP